MNQQDQRKIKAHQNQQTISEFARLETDEMLQETSGRFVDTKPNQQMIPKLLCASGGKCEGICRELHLYRVRTANPKATVKGAKITKSWAEKCPEAYEN